MRTARTVLAACFLLIALLSVSQSQDNPKEWNDDQVSVAKEWFDGLGYDVMRPFVRVATGGWSRRGNNDPVKEFRCGFLQAADDSTFRVLFSDLTEQEFTISPRNTEELERVYYEAADLKEFATAALASAKDPERDTWDRFGARLKERTELFVLARACEMAGHATTADQLYEHVKSLLDEGEDSVRAAIRKDLAYAGIWKLTLLCGDAAIPRTTLQAEFAEFLKHFEGTEYFDTAKEIHDQLAVMVAEDEAHHLADWDDMTTDEKVAELIYQLRDQNAEQWSQPGECDIFDDPRGDESPAGKLVDMGFDAVPKLIDIMDDKRLTRSIGYWRDFVYSHHVLRYGDCAITILSRIAGRSFYERTYTNGYPLKDGKGSAIKQEAAAWWDDVKKRGIESVLAEGVERGDRNSPSQATQLAGRDPRRAIQAIEKGFKVAEEDWVRARLIDVAGNLGLEIAGDFIRDQLLEAEGLQARLSAARVLTGWGQPDGVAAMIAEWQRQAWKDSKDDWGRRDVIKGLADYLLQSGEVEAGKAVAAGIAELSVSERLEVVDAATDLDGKEVALDGDFGRVIEDMLVGRLDDTARTSMSGSRYDWSFSNPPLADCALFALGHLWPAKYPGKPASAHAARALQLVRAKNAWRRSRGMEPLPEPEVPEIKSADKEVLEALWLRATGDDPGDALDQLRKLGLSALAFVGGKLEGHDTEDAAWKPLFALERELSRVVRDVKFDAAGVDGADELEEALTDAKGEVLDTSRLESLLAACISKLPNGAAGFVFDAWRDNDGSGVTIDVSLKPGGPAGKGWDYSMIARLEDDGLLSLSGGSVDSVLREDDAFKELRKPFDQIAAAGPRVAFEVSVQVACD